MVYDPDSKNDYLFDLMRGDGAPDDDTFTEATILDLGHGMKIMFTHKEGVEDPVGLFESHQVDGQPGCGGSVLFDVPANAEDHRTKWQLISLNPLHIEPSVLCGRCGWHGFIRNGRWEPC